MRNNILRSIVLLFLIITTLSESAAQADSINVEVPKKDNFFTRLLHGNVDRSFEKPIDFSFAASPSYTREASFGVGGMATGLYRIDRTDSVMPPSDITLVFNASVKGFYALEARGNNYFKGEQAMLSYEMGFTSKPLDFWGISYEACAVNPIINYTRRQFKVDADYQYKLLRNFYVGGVLDFSYTHVSKIDDITYLEGQKDSYTATGIGASLKYDTRDFIPNPRQGVHLMVRQVIFPETFGNCEKTLHRTTAIIDVYQKLWHGSVLALDIYGQFNSKDSPWSLREELGGNQRMRGYYSGCYIDNNILSTQMELRQNIAQRWGFTMWVGGGTVFPSLNKFDMKNVLPNYGFGLRFELKHNMNARVDYGFGRQTGGFVFNIGEAF